MLIVVDELPDKPAECPFYRYLSDGSYGCFLDSMECTLEVKEIGVCTALKPESVHVCGCSHK